MSFFVHKLLKRSEPQGVLHKRKQPRSSANTAAASVQSFDANLDVSASTAAPQIVDDGERKDLKEMSCWEKINPLWLFLLALAIVLFFAFSNYSAMLREAKQRERQQQHPNERIENYQKAQRAKAAMNAQAVNRAEHMAKSAC